MDLYQFYREIGADYQSVLNRIPREELILKFLYKIREEKSFAALHQAVKEKNYKDAFAAAHTIKGICLNLGLDPLSEIAAEMSDYLRDWERADIDADKVEAGYDQLMEIYGNICQLLEAVK